MCSSPAPSVDHSPYARSLAMLERAHRYVVDGVKRMNRLDDPNHFPVFFERAAGPYAWDVDGHQYIDLISGKGTVLLGYANEQIDAAVMQTINAGSMLPLTGTLYPRVAEEICRTVSSLERVKFLRTGSEAVSAAVRLCRVQTGARKILTAGYHGWHDWFIEDRRPPVDADAPVVDFYYDLSTLETLLARFSGQVAAVVVTPEPSLLNTEHHREIAELSRKHSVPFVLDEVKTGFRYGRGGYQETLGVRPDLTIFGKALANGYAISAVGGSSRIMNAERETHISGTYETENVGLAASLRTLQLLTEQSYAELRDMYGRLADTINQEFQRRQIAARCLASDANAQLVFEDEDEARRFYRAAALDGVLFYCFDDVNLGFQHVAVFDDLLGAVVQVIRRMTPGPKGPEISPAGVHQYLLHHRIVPRASSIDHPVVKAVYARVASI